MGNGQSLDALFFELASQDRLSILLELCSNNFKMQDIARKLDLTATEASRQLQRMNKFGLIERKSDGTYATSNFGKLMLDLSESMEFALKNKKYFSEHNVWQLPNSFVYRLGELSQCSLCEILAENMVRWEAMIKNSEEYVCVMTPQVMPNLSRVMVEKLEQGVKLKSLIEQSPLENLKTYIAVGKNVERKALNLVPFILLITEKEAAVSLPHINGKIDIPTFFGNDPKFLKWTRDLFEHYWNQAIYWNK
jgi:predicted transcriptional regulator